MDQPKPSQLFQSPNPSAYHPLRGTFSIAMKLLALIYNPSIHGDLQQKQPDNTKTPNPQRSIKIQKTQLKQKVNIV